MNLETEHAACLGERKKKNHMGVNLSSTECLSPVRFYVQYFLPGRLLRYASRYATYACAKQFYANTTRNLRRVDILYTRLSAAFNSALALSIEKLARFGNVLH